MKARSPWQISACVALGLVLCSAPESMAEPSHGLSIFGDLKYSADFTHFEYADPTAPKGGEVRLAHAGSYDNLNPFILKGIQLRGIGGVSMLLPFESLMTGAQDEADSLYGLVASSVEVAPDRTWAEFTLRGQAQWHDGTPITAEDVAFSFVTLRDEGAPVYRLSYRDILKAEALTPDTVRFEFVAGATRDLPLLAATMPIISKAYFTENEFNKTTLVPPLGSGPYRIGKVDQGRTLVLERVKDYWAADLPVNLGRFNFDRIRFDFYRDRTVSFEAFKSGEYDFHEEFTSKVWATGYDFPGVRDGLVKREVLPDDSPSGTQAFYLNSRREKLSDPHVREALGYAFDFEWTNENLFYGLYQRTTSMFENSDLRARGTPSAEELTLLEPFRGQVPDQVFTDAFALPVTDGSGNIRRHLLKARELLDAAGWQIVDGRLLNSAGEQMTLEFLSDVPSFERIIAPIVRNMERLGIDARIRLVDSAQYTNRVQEFDFDIVTARFNLPRTPDAQLRNWWGSEAADSPGGLNYAGVKNPVVDALIEKLGTVNSRDELRAVVGALDRVLLWNQYTIPQWFKASHTIAYWDKFDRPALKPRFSLGFLDTWWIDGVREAALMAALGGTTE